MESACVIHIVHLSTALKSNFLSYSQHPFNIRQYPDIPHYLNISQYLNIPLNVPVSPTTQYPHPPKKQMGWPVSTHNVSFIQHSIYYCNHNMFNLLLQNHSYIITLSYAPPKRTMSQLCKNTMPRYITISCIVLLCELDCPNMVQQTQTNTNKHTRANTNAHKHTHTCVHTCI